MITKTKVLLPQVTLAVYVFEAFWFSCSYRHLNYLAFQPFVWCLMKVILSIPDEGYSEHTWWRLFWAYLRRVILNIPDEGYSEHTWWRLFWAYLMKVILSIPDEGYSEHTWWRLFWAYVPDEGYSEHTWWMLFQKHVMHTQLDIYIFINILPVASCWFAGSN